MTFNHYYIGSNPIDGKYKIILIQMMINIVKYNSKYNSILFYQFILVSYNIYYINIDLILLIQ